MIDVLFMALVFGCWGFIYSDKLTEPDEVFGFMPGLVCKIVSGGRFSSMDIDRMDKNFIQRALINWGYRCGVCHAGLLSVIYTVLRFFYFAYIGEDIGILLILMVFVDFFCIATLSMTVAHLLHTIKNSIL